MNKDTGFSGTGRWQKNRSMGVILTAWAGNSKDENIISNG